MALVLITAASFFIFLSPAQSCQHGRVHLTTRYHSQYYGVVQVCLDGYWHSICTDFWDNQDATVVCRQLGFSPYGAIGPVASYQSSSVSKYITDLNCTGSETSILDCPYNGLVNHTCEYNTRYANVYCQAANIPESNCTDGEVRLIGGSTYYEGRVEVCVNKAWGTVCGYGNGWGKEEARIVCSQVGGMKFAASYDLVEGIGFSRGSGPILMGFLNCNGLEANLTLCAQQYFFTQYYCTNHYYDVGLICQAPCEEGEIRLKDGASAASGRIELCHEGTWGTICSDFWDNTDASVLCKQMGYSPYGAIVLHNYYFEREWPHHIIDINCTGAEDNLRNCSQNLLVETYTCSPDHDAAVSCQGSSFPRASCTEGDIRLVAGTTRYEGRIEVCINNGWGGVCSPGWGAFDTRVVCRQLGHMELGSVAYVLSEFGKATVPAFLSDVSCSGRESRLIKCPYDSYTALTCTGSQAGVKCEASCENGTLRLYSEDGSYYRRYGRVQICINNTWGTVCDQYWDDDDASVVCRMLGYSPYGASALRGLYLEGNWDHLIYDLNCTGQEGSIWNCPMNGNKAELLRICTGYHDASVICQQLTTDVRDSDCSNGALRLADGPSVNEGRVEVCYNGVWGSICDSSWTAIEANIVCKTLGHQKYGAENYKNSHYGPGERPMHIYNLDCQSYHTNFTSCRINRFPYYYTGCNRYHEVGVKCDHNSYSLGFTDRRFPTLIPGIDCQGDETLLSSCTFAPLSDLSHCSLEVVELSCIEKCSTGAVRIREGGDYSGHVQVCIGGVWGSICSNDYWNNDDASVLCRQLGFSPYGAIAIHESRTYDTRDPTFYEGLNCRGNETHIFDCPVVQSASVCPFTWEDANIICPVHGSQYSNCTDGQIKLVGGATEYEGTVHMCLNNAWGTVCDRYGFGYEEAQTVCNALGHTTPDAVVYHSAHFGVGSGPILLSYIRCSSPQLSLLHCNQNPEYNKQCTHHNDAGVKCSYCKDGSLRLLGGNTPLTGRVEVCMGGSWGTICDEYWDTNDARVACRQLGYSTEGAVAGTGSYTENVKRTHISDLHCTGNEDTLFDCSHNVINNNCGTYNDAYVTCTASSFSSDNCTETSLRLVGGKTSNEGRVEICYEGVWGSICPNYWKDDNARVACKQLGYTTTGATVSRLFGHSVRPVHYSYFTCSGNENKLIDCRHYISSSCSHSYHAAIICEAPCIDGSTRLRGSSRYGSSGRIEVCLNGTWGTVCSDGFDNNDASVVCRRLGYSPFGALTKRDVYSEIVLSHNIYNVNCTGNEDSIMNCTYNTKPNNESTCRSNDDAVVICQDLGLQYSNCTDYEVKLINGSSPNEGTLQICLNNAWGTVCNKQLNTKDAGVICHQLGYPAEGTLVYTALFTATDTLLVADVHCDSNEERLSECSIEVYYKDSSLLCDVAVDSAGIKCHYCVEGDMRLIPSAGYHKGVGLLEVCINGTWGTICSDFFDDDDAMVACRHLGYSPLGALFMGNVSSRIERPFHVIDVNCTGEEVSIWDCSMNSLLKQYTCNETNNAAVSCLKTDEVEYNNCSDGQIRLSGGSSPLEGRLEVCYGRTWFGVCGELYNSFGKPQSICRLLGYSDKDSEGYTDSFLDLPLLPLFPFKFTGCPLTAVTLLDCDKTPLSCNIDYTFSNHIYTGAKCKNYCRRGDVRLTGSLYDTVGQVEVCINGTSWGTICSDQWKDTDTSVVCRHLGYTPYGAISLPPGIYFSYNYELPVVISRLNCTGSESNVLDCHYTIATTQTCDHTNDAAIICQYNNVTVDTSCGNGDVRLVGGANELEGRVEVCYNKMWGSVCHQGWQTSDANIVCKQLHFQPVGSVVFIRSYYGHGIGPNLLSSLSCTGGGKEESLLECSFDHLYALLDCGDGSVAGTACLETCSNGEVKLSGSTNPLTGRIEFCSKYIWTSICSIHWSYDDAQVACRNLGHSPFGALPTFDCFTEGQLSFGITYTNCTGSELHIDNCTHTNPSLHDCNTHKDAGVICQGLGSVVRADCTNGDVRLVGGSGPHEGRVEVCINEAWGSICTNEWDDKDADVVCKQLGYLPLGARVRSFGPGSGPILLTNVKCNGTESKLIQCHISFCSMDGCTHAYDAGITCEIPCTNGDIRLNDDSTGLRGRVEVCINMSWYTICHHGWTSKEASVVCHQLGHSRYGAVWGSNLFVNYEWPMSLFNLNCTGYESTIWDCSYNTTDDTGFCQQNSDASVFCMSLLIAEGSSLPSNCSDGDIRLIGGRNKSEGNVQMCYYKAWSSICSHGWGTTPANVICRELGYQSYGSTYYINNHFNVSLSPSFVYGTVLCYGDEKRLHECPRNGLSSLLSCTDRDIAGVQCEGVCTDGKVRLSSPSSELIGRVDVCVNGTWSTICDDHWSDVDAAVICRQLGHSVYGSMAAYGVLVYDDLSMSAHDVNCTGNEDTIFQCLLHLSPKETSYTQCSSQWPAGIICQTADTLYANCSHGEVRLVDGPSPVEGRVEVCIHNTWGTVCDSGWDTMDANVICHQLGHQKYGAEPVYWSAYGKGSYPLSLSGLACNGEESNLLKCSRNYYSLLLSCNGEAAGAKCERLCDELSVRIIGTPYANMGRVDLCRNRIWHRVCSFPHEAGSVVCRQLGYSPHGVVVIKERFSAPLIPSYRANIYCPSHKNISSMEECEFAEAGDVQACIGDTDYGVICQGADTVYSNCSHGEVRLTDGRTLTQGRIEICIDGVWGTVCDRGWDAIDANIVCAQLGLYPSGARPRYGAFYDQGLGPIFLSGLKCTGTESNLLNCSRDVLDAEYCRHYEDAGVACQGSYPVIPGRRFGSIFGGELLFVSGPIFELNDITKCQFGTLATDGVYLTETQCLCVVPPAHDIGLTDLRITIKRSEATLSGITQYRYISPFVSDFEDPFNTTTEEFALGVGETFSISWNPLDMTEGLVPVNDVTISIAMILFDSGRSEWEEETILATNIPNAQSQKTLTIPDYPEIGALSIRLVQIRLSVSVNPQSSVPPPLAAVINRVTKSVLRYVVRKIERDTSKRLACERWYNYDDGAESLPRRLPPCPCTLLQMMSDSRYRKETPFQFTVSRVFFKKSKAASCFRERSIGSYSSSQQCCYDDRGRLLTGIGGGRMYRVYPNDWVSIIGHLRFDVTPFYLCCSGFFKACNRYYTKRPNDNCMDWPDRTSIGRVFGDPHLVSLDGHKFTFNGHGEFILLQSLDHSDLMLQARMVEPEQTNRTGFDFEDEGGTVITAVVVRHAYSDTVQFELFNHKLITLVNGDEINFNELGEQEFRNVTLTSIDNTTASAELNTGITITVKEIDVLLEASIIVTDTYYDKTEGLLGSYNTDTSDDLLPRNSSVPLLLNATLREIHYKFGLTWMIHDPRYSIFTYGSNGGWHTFYKPDFVPLFEVEFRNQEFEEEAQEACGEDQYCLFDAAATNNIAIGIATKETEEEQRTIEEAFIPTVCEPSCEYGACVRNDTCYCSNGYDGEFCEIPVYEDCEDNLCLNDAPCYIHAGDYFCNCTDGFSGPFCGIGNESKHSIFNQQPSSQFFHILYFFFILYQFCY
uniref:Deleted in malignant brain tumors 1 protein n=1 Tax=Amphimedon queenslandica TaxID=400682 RepID=A0A1X7ULL6_AMPQE